MSLSNDGPANRAEEAVPRKFLEPKPRVLARGRREAGEELSAAGHVLLQATVRAIKKLAITRENAQGSGLFLQGSQA
jgi:hypothetical protein